MLGETLGPYRILEQIGAGGMGVVYRAHDDRLDRDVAVKVLPAAFSADPDRLRRFEQEARAAGMLNHPNILAIYDIGTHLGAPYVVSELLEGETLRSRLADGALPQRKATDFAAQTARGLAAAHQKGIVHRDLKPENLFLTTDGRLKILDFGLAKLSQPQGPESATNAPTVAAVTEAGAVLGTVGYMSPEQVRGKPVDHRSDLFSLGAILYEMLAGRRAFQGESAIEIMNAILKEDPPELAAANPNLAPALDRIIRHCLEKNPEERFHAARDLAFDLESVSGASGTTSGAAPAAPSAPAARKFAPVVLAVIALAAVAAAYFIGRHNAATPPPLFRQLTFQRGTIQAARFAPDGRTILYAASWNGKPIELFSTQPETPESRHMGLPPAGVFSIASSGEIALCLGCRFTAAFGHGGTLARVSSGGGAPREVLEGVQDAEWSPDGKELAVTSGIQMGKQRLEFPIGKILYETSGWIGHPRVSPKGDRIAFIDHRRFADDGAVVIIDLAGKKQTLSDGWTSVQGLAWSPDGKEIWFTATKTGGARALYAVNPSSGGSSPARLITRVTGSLTLQDISRDGRVLIVHETARMAMQGLAPGGTEERDLSWLDWSLARGLSDDGTTVVFDETGEATGGNYSVYIRRMDGSPAVRLGDGVGAAISPDGKWALSGTKPGSGVLLVLLPTRAGQPKPLPRGSISRYVRVGWFPDSRRILMVGEEAGHGLRTYVQDIDQGDPRPILPEGVLGALVSPDGQWILTRTPEQKVALYPVAGGSPRLVAGVSADGNPLRWSADGRYVYVRSFEGVAAKIYRLDVSTGRKELWKEIMPRDPAGIRTVGSTWFSADGKAYVYSYTRVLSDLYLVEGLR